jgi:integrase
VASIRERSPGVFEIRVFVGRDDDGRPVQTSRTVRGSRRQAERAAASLTVKAPSQAAARTVADALEAWLEVNLPTWAPSSVENQLSRSKLVASDPIASVPLARLSVHDIEQWHARLRRNGVGEGSIRNQHSTLRAAMAQAEAWSWLSVNPARLAKLRRPKVQQRGVMFPEEAAAVLSAAYQVEPRAGLAIRLAAVAGLRRAELAALRFRDFHGHELVVDSAVAIDRRAPREDESRPVLRDDPTKTGSVRKVALDDGTLELVEMVRAAQHPGTYVFGDRDEPANPERIHWWWVRARELSGIDKHWRLHDLRHFSASMAIAGGHDVRSVAGRLGHSNPAMTLRVYAHTVQGHDARIAEDLGRLLPFSAASGDAQVQRAPLPADDHPAPSAANRRASANTSSTGLSQSRGGRASPQPARSSASVPSRRRSTKSDNADRGTRRQAPIRTDSSRPDRNSS